MLLVHYQLLVIYFIDNIDIYSILISTICFESLWCSLNVGEKAKDKQIMNGTYWPDRAHRMIGEKRLSNIEDCFTPFLI